MAQLASLLTRTHFSFGHAGSLRVVPTVGRLWQEDRVFEVILEYIMKQNMRDKSQNTVLRESTLGLNIFSSQLTFSLDPRGIHPPSQAEGCYHQAGKCLLLTTGPAFLEIKHCSIPTTNTW